MFLLSTCVFVFVCASVPGQRLMRYECILPSSMVFLGVTVKVNLGTRERVHGWRRQGHVSPARPIWFRGLCSTLHLLFLPNLCTWGGKVKRERSLVCRNLCTQILFYTEFSNTYLESYLLSFSAIWTFSNPSPTQCSLFLCFLCADSALGLFFMLTFLKEAQKPAANHFKLLPPLALLYLR